MSMAGRARATEAEWPIAPARPRAWTLTAVPAARPPSPHPARSGTASCRDTFTSPDPVRAGERWLSGTARCPDRSGRVQRLQGTELLGHDEARVACTSVTDPPGRLRTLGQHAVGRAGPLDQDSRASGRSLTISTRRVPSPVISPSSRSPTLVHTPVLSPTPAWVPVSTTSPG